MDGALVVSTCGDCCLCGRGNSESSSGTDSDPGPNFTVFDQAGCGLHNAGGELPLDGRLFT